uniref:MH1 domain-containing protein n=1 Tax=Steinernema glaseri TaxID=37863 RepID=A0A1I8ARA2_9BILA
MRALITLNVPSKMPSEDTIDHRHRSGSCTALTLKQLSLNVNPDHPPNVGEPCGTLVAFLKHFHVGGDDEFTIKAIESLIKKLKDKRNELEVLLRVVAKRGEVPEVSECITIPRTLDGRLQVAGRKGFPHVVYARIWRWPDLHKNELKHVPHCTSAFDMKTDSVCINPFHYERIQSPPVGLGGFDMNPGLGVPGPGPSNSGLGGLHQQHQFGEQPVSLATTSGIGNASDLVHCPPSSEAESYDPKHNPETLTLTPVSKPSEIWLSSQTSEA